MLLRFGGIVFVIMLAIWLYCLLDAITADEAEVRWLPKVVWVLILLFTFEVGVALWLVLGRPRREAGATGRPGPAARRDQWSGWPRGQAGPDGSRGRALGGPADRSGQLAPDDDPEFLARLNEQANDEHQQLLGRWEADLRRREEELRRRESGEDEDRPRPDDQRG
jgi:hypothetical protein